MDPGVRNRGNGCGRSWPLLLTFVPGWLGKALGLLALAAALPPVILGSMMGLYAIIGKRRFRDWMLARHEWRGDETVLDVGAGRGLMAVGAAKRLTTTMRPLDNFKRPGADFTLRPSGTAVDAPSCF